MKKEKNQKKPKRKIRLVHIVAVAFVAYFGYTLFDQQVQLNKYDSQIGMYKSDIDNKKALSEYYGTQKNAVESDEYIEKVARESLGYVKPYEKIFVDANH